MNILDMLKKGKSVEDLTEEFYDNLESAVTEYEAWKKAEEEKAKALAQKKLEEGYAREKRAKAREALGAAIIEYFSTLDVAIDEETYKNVDLIIDALPKIKVVRSNFGGWF